MLIMDKKKKSNGDRRDKRRYSDFLVGLGLGAVGVVILSLIFKPRCPKCGKKILRGIQECPFCGANLQ
jgi:zinc-ribbon domain